MDMKMLRSKPLKQPPSHFKFLLYRFWVQFKHSYIWLADNTDIHGLHLTINQETTIFTRVFFAVSSCFGIAFCIYLIYIQIINYQAKSIIASITSTAYPVWKVRFPAVTICNMNVVYNDRLSVFKDPLKAQGISESLIDDMVQKFASLITYETIENASRFDVVEAAIGRSGMDFDDMMEKMNHPCETMLKQCIWQTHVVNCSKLFTQVKTTFGYCCAFNYYGTHQTRKYYDDSEYVEYQYVRGAGSTFSLTVTLDPEEKQYTSAIGSQVGFVVQVQEGGDFPDLDFQASTVLKAEEATFSVTPTVFSSTDGVKDVEINKRNCIFQDEGNIQWSDIYSYSSCLTECKAKAILRYCNCTPYYYPVVDNVRICTLQDLVCLNHNKYNYSSMANSQDLQMASQTTNVNLHVPGDCDCYPQCVENMFEYRVNSAATSDAKTSNDSIIKVYYSHNGCILTERDLYTSWQNVLASIGGTFGLCMGGSLISCLEILYFLANSIFFCNKYQGVIDERYQEKIKIDRIRAQMYPPKHQYPIPTHIYSEDFAHMPLSLNHPNLKRKSNSHPKFQIIINGIPTQ